MNFGWKGRSIVIYIKAILMNTQHRMNSIDRENRDSNLDKIRLTRALTNEVELQMGKMHLYLTMEVDKVEVEE